MPKVHKLSQQKSFYCVLNTLYSFWLDKHPNLIKSQFCKEFILESLQFVLKNNNFFFDDQYFNQRSGTVMGTIVAPTYATLVMGYLEILMYIKLSEQFSYNTSEYIEDNWDRFLDDCYITLYKDIITPNQLLDVINNLHPQISFTMETHTNMLPFLDILINKAEDKIWMYIYYKTRHTMMCTF